jgi:FixJ family two-component response regulator
VFAVPDFCESELVTPRQGQNPYAPASLADMLRGMVILVGKDWQARALVRAQLLEEGLDAEAYETASEALEGLGEVLPALLIADLTAGDDPSAEIEALAAWSGQIPIWIIAGRSLILGKNFKSRGFEMILFRPVDVGELVEQIKRRVAET